MENQSEIKIGRWLWEKGMYPKCSGCGGYFFDSVIGEIGKGHGWIEDTKYCPYCGAEMAGQVRDNGGCKC